MHFRLISSSLLMMAVLFCSSVMASGQDAEPLRIVVNPTVIEPVNGKLPATVNLAIAETNCDEKSGTALSKDDKVRITGGGLTASAITSFGRCWVIATVTVDPNTPAGNNKVFLVDKDDKVLGSANLAVLNNTAGLIPPGLAPEVDVMWQVMSQGNCSDVFGKRVSQSEYCIQVKIGNNSGYPLQIAGVGFTSKLKNLMDQNLDITISNNSYASTRAILIKENVTNFRNVLYNSIQAAGVLMAAFTPYFHATNPKANWSTAAAIVSGPLLAAFNVVVPNPVITQLNNLDDQSFRDNRIIPNNTQILTVVFVDKQALTLQLASYNATLQQGLNKLMEDQKNKVAAETNAATKTAMQDRIDITEQMVSKAMETSKSTVRNSTNPSEFYPFTRKGSFDPLLVKLALGNLVIVGQEIQYLQRVQIQSAATPSSSLPLQAAPSSQSFTAPLLGSVTKPIVLTNKGSSQLTSIAAQFTGANKDDFSVPANTCTTIDAGANCTLNVTFTPTAKKSPDRSATMQLTFSGGSTPASVTLAGTASFEADKVGISPVPDLKAAAGSSTKGTLTLANVNDGPITISPPPAIKPTGSPFSISDNKCTGSLASETTCTIEVTFSPPKGAAAGAQSATLTVNYQVNGAATKAVLLAGTVQ